MKQEGWTYEWGDRRVRHTSHLRWATRDLLLDHLFTAKFMDRDIWVVVGPAGERETWTRQQWEERNRERLGEPARPGGGTTSLEARGFGTNAGAPAVGADRGPDGGAPPRGTPAPRWNLDVPAPTRARGDRGAGVDP